VALGSVINEACEELISDPDLPWSTGRDLLTGDESIIEPSVDRGGREAEEGCRLLDVDELSRWGLLMGL